MLKKKLTYQEKTWTGLFGNQYTKRNSVNKKIINDCEKVFLKIFKKTQLENFKNILEVGCNQGRNLRALKNISNAELFAIEPNESSRKLIVKKKVLKKENLKNAFVVDLPFSDNFFDLVFTSVVLIHIPENQIIKAMSEINRVSKKFILCIEYFNPTTTTIKYRGKKDLLFKRDYGSLYMENFKNLELVDYGFFWKKVTEQDNVTWWLFKKR